MKETENSLPEELGKTFHLPYLVDYHKIGAVF
jgi:hypothetical protein